MGPRGHGPPQFSMHAAPIFIRHCCGGQGAKPPEADDILALEHTFVALSCVVFEWFLMQTKTVSYQTKCPHATLHCLITLPECMTSLWDACSSSFCISELYTIEIVAATLITPHNSKHKYCTRRITLLLRMHPLLFDLHWWKNSQVFGILIIETVVKLGWACPGRFTN